MNTKQISTKNKPKLATTYIVKVAVMAALLTSLKFALSMIPNVEVVTLLILVYASTFGLLYTIPAVLIFCLVEVAIYGAGSWVLLYFLYWPLLALLASIFLRKQNIIIAILIGAIMSIFFGVLSASADTLFAVVNLSPADLSKYWIAYYIRGLYFDITHIISNIAIVGFLYVPLVKVVQKNILKPNVLNG